MLGTAIPKMSVGYFLRKRKGNGLFLGKTCLTLLMTPYYDVNISGKECLIKLEWVVQLR